MWQHERDKFGNIVLKVDYRSINNPPICVPNKTVARQVDAPFTKAGAFGYRGPVCKPRRIFG